MAITLEELVDRFGGQLIGDGRVPVVGFAPLDNADADHITFLTNPRLRNEVSRSKAAALIISPQGQPAGRRFVRRGEDRSKKSLCLFRESRTAFRQPQGGSSSARYSSECCNRSLG